MTKLVYTLIAITLAITVFISCPYLYDQAYAAAYDCDNGHASACDWLQAHNADADAHDTSNTCHASNTCLPTKTTNNPFTQ
jgi:hypothetical protein